MGKDGAFPPGAGAEQHRGHRSSHAGADSGDIGLNQLHGVVDGETGADLASGRVDVEGNVGFFVKGCQVEQLGLHGICHVAVDGVKKSEDGFIYFYLFYEIEVVIL